MEPGLPRRRQMAGFTLIELLVVVTIIGILAGLATVNVRNAQRRAAENVLKGNLAQLRKAIDDFYADRQKYPASLQELVDTKYLRRIPDDPITKSPDTWIELQEEPDYDGGFSDGDFSMPGVVDVRSGAEGQTLDDPPIAYGDL